MMDKETKQFDVVIVGGGPAGLNAALILGRSLRSVAVIDDNHPRHAVTYESHGFLTQDGVKPVELRRAAHQQMKKYHNVTIEHDYVLGIEQLENSFKTITETGVSYLSRKVIFAAGMKDELPSIDGLNDIYGHRAFLCPYCDGWEYQNQRLAVLGNGEKIYRYTKEIHHWSSDLILFTNGPVRLDNKQIADIRNHGVQIIEEKIQRIDSDDEDVKVVLESGQALSRDCLFLGDTLQKQASHIPETLGIETNSNGSFKTERHGRTELDGFFIVGDAKNVFSGVIKAACEGYEVAEIVNNQLIEEDWNAKGAKRS